MGQNKALVYKLYAMLTNEENVAIATQYRFQRITPSYILVYGENEPEGTKCTEVKAEDISSLSRRDFQWLQDANMTIIRELTEDHKPTQTNAIKEFLLELDKNIKHEISVVIDRLIIKEGIEKRLQKVEAVTEALPGYRQQSLKIQQELKQGQQEVKAELKAEQSQIVQLCKTMNSALTSLTEEFKIAQQQTNEREKNDLRQKLIREYKLFTDPRKNPCKAWSDMEQKAFMSQVRDYEALGGNDYIHKTVLPAMYMLEIVPMDNLARLEEVMSSRQQ